MAGYGRRSYRRRGEQRTWPRNRVPRRASGLIPDGRAVIEAVLDATNRDIAEAEAKAVAGGKKKFKKDLNFAIAFAKYMGVEVAKGLDLISLESSAARSRLALSAG